MSSRVGGRRRFLVLAAWSVLGCAAPDGEEPTEIEDVGEVSERLTLVGTCPAWGNPNFATSNAVQTGDVVATPNDDLQAKLNLVPAGKRLVLTSGIFKRSTPLLLRSYTKIVGQGPTATIIFATGDDFSVLDGRDVDTVQLRDFQINGDHNGVSHCVRFDGSDDIRIDNLHVRNCGHYGFGFQGDKVHQDLHMSNTWISHTGGDGIDFKNRACGNRNLVFNRVRIDYFGEGAGQHDQAGLDVRGADTIINDLWIVHQSESDSYGLRFRQTDSTNGCAGGGSVNGLVVLAHAGLTGTRGVGLYGLPTTLNNFCVNSGVTLPCSGSQCPSF
jgi:hypothetical protein